MMGGKISVDSELGRGTAFSVSLKLPIAKAKVEEKPVEEAPDIINAEEMTKPFSMEELQAVVGKAYKALQAKLVEH